MLERYEKLPSPVTFAREGVENWCLVDPSLKVHLNVPSDLLKELLLILANAMSRVLVLKRRVSTLYDLCSELQLQIELVEAVERREECELVQL